MAEFKTDFYSKLKSLRLPLILDGAMGTLLNEKNVDLDSTLWSSLGNITHPDKVLDIHRSYIDAGADIITSNTFRTNPTAYQKSMLNISNEQFVKRSVELANEAAAGRNVIIAGSNSPAEDCYQVERNISIAELEYNHSKHIELLWQSGADIIWNETQSHWDEIEIICRFCSANSFPFAVNLYFTPELKLLSGENLSEAVRLIEDYSPQLIGFNCIKQNVFERYLNKFSLPKNWGFYFNCGMGKITDEKIVCGIQPEEYVKSIQAFLEYKPMFIGSCCGSNPDHTKAIKDYLDEVYRN